jgi:outer membrane protein insertion porin family
MAKALAACCLVIGLCAVGWAQEATPTPPATQTQEAAPQASSSPAEQPQAPAPAPESPAPPQAEPAPAQPEQPPTEAQPAPAPEQPQPSTEAQPAPAPEQPQPSTEAQPAPAPEQPQPPTEAQPAPAEQPGPTITGIQVRGNEQIKTDVITAALTARVGEPYTQALAQAQEKAVRDLGWFYDVKVTTEPTEQGVLLVVSVVENPVIKGIVIEGNTVYSTASLASLMESKPGEVENSNTIIRDLKAIQDKYEKAGYIFARVIDVATDREGNLIITLVEGQVEAIRITGNRKTKSYVITREMRTKPGDILNSDRLRRDLDRLINLEIFQDVSAQLPVGSAPGKVIVVINVVEKKTGLAAAGVGYSSVQKLVGFVDVAEANLAGTGQKITLRTEFGGRQSYELGYFNPWIAPPANSLQVGLYNKLILREAFTANEGFLYDEKRIGGNITWSRPLGASETTRIYGTLRADSVSVQQAEDEQLLPEVIALQRAEDVRSIGVALRNDTRNIIANPTQGGLNSVSIETAGWLGGAQFNKLGTDVRRYFRAGGKRVFATRLLLGLTTGNPPFLEQYLIGGGDTLRGYRQDRFPGKRMAILNTELRIPFQQNLAGVLFVDVGDAWGGRFAADFGDTSFTPHVGYGVGIRLVTPIGPIRIDYGIGSEGNETHFSVGHAF